MPFWPNTDQIKKRERVQQARQSDLSKVILREAGAAQYEEECRQAELQLARAHADDAKLDEAAARTRTAERRHKIFSETRREIEDELKAGAAELAKLREGALRAESADQAEAWGARVIEFGKKFDDVCGPLAEICERAASAVPEAGGVAMFLASAKTELPAALEMIVRELNSRAREVRNGIGPAQWPSPAPKTPPVWPTPEPVQIVFLMKPIAYVDQGGALRQEPANFEAALPPAIAVKALACGAAIPGDSATAKKVRAAQREPRLTPVLQRCVCLDDLAKAKRAAAERADAEKSGVVVHGAFEVVDRGPPRAFQTEAGNPVPEQIAVSGRSVE